MVMATRSGLSEVSRGIQRYKLPVDLENSLNPQVKQAAKAVQDEDTNVRKIIKEAEKSFQAATQKEEQDRIRSYVESQKKQFQTNALNYLLEAEKHATGDEKLAVQLELAQRYRDTGNYELAVTYYKLVAQGTDQEYLKEDCLKNAEKYEKEIPKRRTGQEGNK